MKKHISWKPDLRIILCSSLLLTATMKLIASDDADGNFGNDAGGTGSGSDPWAMPYDCFGRAGAHPQDNGCRGHCGDQGANGPGHRLCGVRYSGAPDEFFGYDDEVFFLSFEAKGANGPDRTFGPS